VHRIAEEVEVAVEEVEEEDVLELEEVPLGQREQSRQLHAPSTPRSMVAFLASQKSSSVSLRVVQAL
jgi:hypothetical protein